jgi:hypothetical protein
MEDADLFVTLGLYRDIFQFRTNRKCILDVLSQDVVKGLLHPGVLVFIGGTTRANRDIHDCWSFGKLRMLQIATQTDAVSKDWFVFPAFDTKHDCNPFLLGSLSEIYTIDY